MRSARAPKMRRYPVNPRMGAILSPPNSPVNGKELQLPWLGNRYVDKDRCFFRMELTREFRDRPSTSTFRRRVSQSQRNKAGGHCPRSVRLAAGCAKSAPRTLYAAVGETLAATAPGRRRYEN